MVLVGGWFRKPAGQGQPAVTPRFVARLLITGTNGGLQRSTCSGEVVVADDVGAIFQVVGGGANLSPMAALERAGDGGTLGWYIGAEALFEMRSDGRERARGRKPPDGRRQ